MNPETIADDHSQADAEFYNILLWLPNWIGDAVLALPAIQSLRDRYKNARISAIAKPPADELILHYPAFDSVIPIPYNREDGILEQIQFARSLRKYRFDLGVLFPNSFRSALLLYFSGVRARLGYATEGRSLLLTHAAPLSAGAKKAYRADYFRGILAPLDLHRQDAELKPFISRDTINDAERKLLEMGIENEDFSIAVHPGGSKLPRAWHAERYGILCQKLIKEYQAKIILIGSAKDMPLLDQIAQFCPPAAIFKMTQSSLLEIACVIMKSRLFLGNDSGMMHIAALVGTPVVGIFGPGSPALTGPFVAPSRQVIVTKNYPCSPCRQRFFKDCKPSAHGKPYCIEDISVLDVIEAVEKMMGIKHVY